MRLVNSKLLINVFVGGKASGSAVKFSRFYLIIDTADCSTAPEQESIDPMKIIHFYQKFMVGLKKAIAATKAGEAGFK